MSTILEFTTTRIPANYLLILPTSTVTVTTALPHTTVFRVFPVTPLQPQPALFPPSLRLRRFPGEENDRRKYQKRHEHGW
jgi:hypothetical protein